MKTVKLYRYAQADGSVMVTPKKQNKNDKATMYRIIADEGKCFTDGTNKFIAIDTDDITKYTEIDDVSEV